MYYYILALPNSLDSSQGDQYANQIGRLLGSKYPKIFLFTFYGAYVKKSDNNILLIKKYLL